MEWSERREKREKREKRMRVQTARRCSDHRYAVFFAEMFRRSGPTGQGSP